MLFATVPQFQALTCAIDNCKVTNLSGIMLKLVKRFWSGEPEILPRRGRITIPAERVSSIYAIGDIHGCLDLLVAAEERIFQHVGSGSEPALVVYLGDYVDRGPNSKGTIDHLMQKLPRPLYRICVCGNHDDTFLNFVRGDRFDPAWFDLGGERTLLSYGVDAMHLLALDPQGERLRRAVTDHVPLEHLNFLAGLPVSVSVGNYLFVHAGIVPGVPLNEQSDLDMMWIREPFLSKGPALGITVVHGHTPSELVQYGPNRIGIDTAAYATGKLTVLHIGPDGVAEL
jgi:serine/threonine protein phosphatase 1